MKRIIEIFQKCFSWFEPFSHRVLLCDLDGTLIVTRSGKTFPENASDWVFKKGIREAIVKYNPKYIFIISNQGGIGKGFVSRCDFYSKFHVIKEEMKSWGNFIVDGCCCESNDQGNKFRKPNIGMVDFFRHDYINGYDFSNWEALMIGDASGKKGQFSDSDLQCAKNAGIRYCDVDDFIWAALPCLNCAHSACSEAGEFAGLACAEYGATYRGRLKSVITK